jgi:hypothetical protein
LVHDLKRKYLREKISIKLFSHIPTPSGSKLEEKKNYIIKIIITKTYTEAISTTIESVCRSSSHLVGLRSNGPDISPKFEINNHWIEEISYQVEYSSIQNL